MESFLSNVTLCNCVFWRGLFNAKSSPPELVRPSAIDNDHLLSLYSTTKDIQCTATTSTGHTRILTANSDTTDYEGATYYYVGKIDNYEHYVACTNDEPLLTMVYSLQNRIVIYSITSATVLAVFVIFEVSNFMNKRIDKKRCDGASARILGKVYRIRLF